MILIETSNLSIKKNFSRDVKCVFCEKCLDEAPTDSPWIQIRIQAGIHFKCVKYLAGIVKSIESQNDNKL